jgi:hypothetical protein
VSVSHAEKADHPAQGARGMLHSLPCMSKARTTAATATAIVQHGLLV